MSLKQQEKKENKESLRECGTPLSTSAYIYGCTGRGVERDRIGTNVQRNNG